jgi:hypothetical protein
MRNRLDIALFLLWICGITLNAGVGWASTAESILPLNDESIAGAPPPPSPVKEDGIWNLPKSSGWEKRIFDKPYTPYYSSKSQFRSPNGSGIPLKSPGMLPGIEFGVEMHSFQALQSVVPPESLSRSFSSQQNQPLLLPPSNISPDYNAGFLRFNW